MGVDMAWEVIKGLFLTPVHNKEAEFITSAINERKKVLLSDPQKAEDLFHMVMKESDRLKPEGKFDEEEHIIGQLSRPKRKK